ncbi:MAG: hypothetical protein KBC94_00765 [Pseudacidovorax sp.]|uniref:restriction endonuclease-related protein n=1 Tax=Pseudacidovorax sp. TaxID=1934311 RepID=UPI001B41046F|nr:hypothetical protein [Pseudacidovorax sp.]MBP6892925.1 hypothetical protein [Pseudacidovorax sp.]
MPTKSAPPPDAKSDQKAFLVAAKRILSAGKTRLTWDVLAAILGVEPRAMKTYRMPAASSDYRTMPKLLVEKIEALVAEAQAPSPAGAAAPPRDPYVDWKPRSDPLKLLPASLAALVIRQARQVFMGGGATMVSGVDRLWSGVSGLGDEDRKAMALVSRARLTLGLSDVGAEIHQLLAQCTKPLGEWLPLPAVKEAGLNAVCLIDAEDYMPTLEAEELSEGFGGMTGLLEEQVFAAFQDSLSKHSAKDANDYYTAVRTFVVRNPVATRKQLLKFLAALPSAVWACIEQQFYEPLPGALVAGETATLCGHCNNVMTAQPGGLRCMTAACAAEHAATPGRTLPAADLLRLNRSLRKYWLEPGIDEIRLADRLAARGHTVRMYPNRDMVDLDLGEGSPVGIDLKAYSSPELLGERLRRRPGGLKNYKTQLLVIPDWMARRVPHYVERVSACLEGSSIRALTLSDTVEVLGHA